MLFRGTLLWNLASFLQGNWKQWFFFCFCVQRLYVEVWLKIFHRSDQRFFGGMLLPAKFSSLRALFMDMIFCLCINLYQDLATKELQMSFGEMLLRTFTFVLHGKLNLSTEHHKKIKVYQNIRSNITPRVSFCQLYIKRCPFACTSFNCIYYQIFEIINVVLLLFL